MGRRIPIGNPVEGRGWWGRLARREPSAGKPGVAPAPRNRFPLISGFDRFWRAAGKFAMRALALGLVTPAAAQTNPRGLLTSGPEPANLIVMGLALFVLFVFRRFRKTS